MTSLDQTTLSFAAAVVAVVFLMVPVFLLAVVEPEDRRSLRYWIAGAAALVIATLVTALDPTVADTVELMVANIATTLGLGWLYLAVQRLLGHVGPRWPVYAVVGLVAVATVLWGVVTVNPTVRIAVNSVLIAWFPAITVVMLIRRRAVLGTVVTAATSAVFALIAATYLIRAVVLLTSVGSRLSSVDADQAVASLPLLLELIFGTWTGAVLALIVSARISSRLRIERDLVASMNRQLQVLSTTDHLTGLANRARTDEQLGIEVRRATARGVPVSLIMLDIDRFKGINDDFGHPVGDEVLVATAGILTAGVRETDLVGRWGGEEFLVVLPATGADEAAAVAQRLRAAVADYRFPLPRQVTASLGVAAYRPGDDVAQLVARADTRLYDAKRQGRNRVITG